jgi:hypothetical protein
VLHENVSHALHLDESWWRWEELNLRHGAYETPALPLSYTAVSRRAELRLRGILAQFGDSAGIDIEDVLL